MRYAFLSRTLTCVFGFCYLGVLFYSHSRAADFGVLRNATQVGVCGSVPCCIKKQKHYFTNSVSFILWAGFFLFWFLQPGRVGSGMVRGPPAWARQLR